MPSPKSADQRRFLVGENSTGSFLEDDEMPLQLTPRYCGQSSAKAVPAPPSSKIPAASQERLRLTRQAAEVIGLSFMFSCSLVMEYPVSPSAPSKIASRAPTGDISRGA